MAVVGISPTSIGRLDLFGNVKGCFQQGVRLAEPQGEAPASTTVRPTSLFASTLAALRREIRRAEHLPRHRTHFQENSSLSPDAQLAQLALTWTVVHYSHKMNGSAGFKSKAFALRRGVSALRRGAA